MTGDFVSAVPGSGKTETLIKQCYELMEEKGVESVVAITFTERAASELMERLKKMALNNHRAEIVKELPESNVGTIHNFCSKIVRKYGSEVDIHWSFRVMDELESTSLLERSVRSFVIRTRNDKKVGEISLILERIIDEFETDLEQVVRDLTEIMESHKGYFEFMKFREGGFYTKFSKLMFSNEVLKELSSRLKISMLPDLVSLLDALVDNYREIKKSARLMDFDDLLLYTLKILDRRGAEISKKFKYILVDEFQDTDELQIAIFESFRQNGSSFFVVGDLNQSIYSFRGAQPGAQRRFSSMISNKTTLKTNRRSARNLIGFYNKFFPSIIESEEMEGFLEEEGGAYCHIDADNLMSVAEIVKKKLIEGIKEGDIAILSRTSGDFFNLRRYLRKEGIQSVLVSGESILKSQEGLDILSIIRYLADPGDEVAQVSLLFSPLYEMSVSQVLEIKGKFDQPLDEKLGGYRGLLKTENIDFVLNKVLSKEGYIGRLLGTQDGEERVARLYRIMEMLSSRVKQYGGDLYSTVEWMKNAAESKENGPIEDLLEDRSRVKIMTIHQAKGLEFDVVIVYDLRPGKDREKYYSDEYSGLVVKKDKDFLNSPSKKIIGISEKHTFSTGEELRILYVAFTRAKKELHLVIDPKNLKDERTAKKCEDLICILQTSLGIWRDSSVQQRKEAILKIGMIPMNLKATPSLEVKASSQEKTRVRPVKIESIKIQDDEENLRAIEQFIEDKKDRIEKLRLSVHGSRVTISKNGIKIYEDFPVPNNYYAERGKIEFRL